MGKPSVLLVNQSFYPDEAATGQIFSDLALHLQANDFRVSALTSLSGYNQKIETSLNKERWNGVDIRRSGKSNPKKSGLGARLYNFTTQALSFFQTYLLIKKHSLTIVGTSPPLLVLFIYLANIFKRTKLIVWNMDSFPEAAEAASLIGSSTSTFKLLVWLRNWVYNNCFAIVSLDSTMTEKLVSAGIKQDKIVEIPVWLPKLTPQICRDYKSELQLQNHYIVLYAGNMGVAHDEQSVFKLIDSCKDIQKIKFVIVGGGSGNQWLKNQVSKSGLINTVFYTHQPFQNLKSLIEMADTHLVALKKEFVGIVYPSKIYGIAEWGQKGILLGATGLNMPSNIYQLSDQDASTFIRNDFCERNFEGVNNNAHNPHRTNCLDKWNWLCQSIDSNNPQGIFSPNESCSNASFPNAS